MLKQVGAWHLCKMFVHLFEMVQNASFAMLIGAQTSNLAPSAGYIGKKTLKRKSASNPKLRKTLEATTGSESHDLFPMFPQGHRVYSIQVVTGRLEFFRCRPKTNFMEKRYVRYVCHFICLSWCITVHPSDHLAPTSMWDFLGARATFKRMALSTVSNGRYDHLSRSRAQRLHSDYTVTAQFTHAACQINAFHGESTSLQS